MTDGGHIAINAKVEADNIHQNTNQTLIVITEDKTRLLLHEFSSALQSRSAWLAPAGILVSLFVTDITATFTQKFGLSKDTWIALFYFATFASAVWLLIALRHRPKARSIDDLVNSMKSKSDD
jgi:hypothetical protein